MFLQAIIAPRVIKELKLIWNRSYKKKRGLVLEGGGMRSSYMAGVLMAFRDFGLTDFDVVVGSSAGAACGANFIAGEPEKNKIILEDHLTGSQFVRYSNLFSKENILDIDYFIDDVCTKKVPFNVEAIKNSDTTLFVSATDYLTGEATYFNSHEHNIHEIIKASCAMPYLYRKKAYVNGRRYLDGGIVAPIPLEQAILEGCNDVIVIGTRESGYRLKKNKCPTFFHDFMYSDSPSMGEAFKVRHHRYNETFALMNRLSRYINISYISPQKKLSVTRTTRSKKKVKHSIHQGYEDGAQFCRQRLAQIKAA